MKKIYPTSTKSRSCTGWNKHLKKFGKRLANKSTRKIFKIKSKITNIDYEEKSNTDF